MRILVSGSKGFIGTKLVSSLKSGQHDVVRLSRSASSRNEQEIFWNPIRNEIDAGRLENFDAVIHLAGETLAEGRWTEEKKKRIRFSRVWGTRLLADSLARMSKKPKVLVCASAIGFYGHRGGEILTETSPRGTGFLPDVCEAWENAARPAREAGIRVVHVRTGLVLGSGGGALAKMVPPFKLGLGGPLGSGRQYMSWVSLEDTVGIFEFAMNNAKLEGPVNAVAPHPVTNGEFTKTLAAVLSRPAVLPAPAFGLRLLFGEMADALLLSSARVLPERLSEVGYGFKHSGLGQTLRSSL